MIQINSIKSKKEHSIAAQIPMNLWISVFNSKLLWDEQSIQNKTVDSIIRSDLPTDNKQAFILTLILYPNIGADELIRFARAVLQLNDKDIFELSAALGQLDTLKWLNDHVPGKIVKRKHSPDLICTIAANGHLTTLEWLVAQRRDQLKEGWLWYSAFCKAAANGHLEMLKWFIAQTPSRQTEMIRKRDYEAFSQSVVNGVDILEWFAEQAPDEVIQMIESKEYFAFGHAAANGQIAALEWLVAKAGHKLTDMIVAKNYYAFREAGANGHLQTLEWLATQAPQELIEMIRSYNYYAFGEAAANGHLQTLEWLATQAPQELIEMIRSYNYYAFREAARNNHYSVCHWLLRNASCLAYAESHVSEYGAIVFPFIESTLSKLHLASESHHGPDPYNLTDPEDAWYCFYILRNLIRRNDRNLDDEIRFLLNIPSVKSLAHQRAEGQTNELLRLALHSGNREAAEILLNIEAVRVLAEENNFYQNEVNRGIDLSQLARDRESSMTALTSGEQKRLDAAIKRYEPMLKQAGVANLMDALRYQLAERYQANPARITVNGQLINLPLEFADFQQLNLEPEAHQEALKAYYQNKDHTALRYLSKPNHWMDKKASYVCVNEDKTERWSTFEEYQPLIVMLWLAAIDETMPPINGHTLEGRLNHFVEELALLGRAHNWDKKRINSRNKEEEYDDLKGDKPSCFSGVKRRLFQAVIGHPLLDILTKDNILQEIRDFARTFFDSQIKEENRVAFYRAFTYYLTMLNVDEVSAQCLSELNLPEEKQRDFILYLIKKYGDSYLSDRNFTQLVETMLALKPDSTDISEHFHALKLDGLTALYNTKLQSSLGKIGEAGFFAETSDESTEATRAATVTAVDEGTVRACAG
ncbi:ankyrin repeat domain-containing protein [Legionella maceachernii]|uniref:Ankyrin repeat family transporter protein n=1 Tax=Legionella maceachernii TaxID=466 RepID=A0A0W0WED2_9GAMM|nr:ankyrin repeat domain-containing protein [Legionella maceachernii]KTD30671.1 ankyrin repeat family transporter protein [Legionella maceachernii]SJZ80666.1 hypothetical protein SAMN02745128_01138 [Legionella maceachernii]SUP02822.1 Ankyrin repeats (3 copies) [Legionella maceachernii]